MKRIFFALLATVAAAFAQPSGYVTKSASGTTNCYAYFEPAARSTALAAGDLVYRVATTNNTPVGAATLRLSPTAWALPQYAPARLALDGTSACSINSATVNYGP